MEEHLISFIEFLWIAIHRIPFPVIPIQIPIQFSVGCGQLLQIPVYNKKKFSHKCQPLFQECLIRVIVQYSLAWLWLDKTFSSNPVIKDWSLCFCLSASVSVCLTHSREMVCAGAEERHGQLWPRSGGHISIAPFFAFILPHQKGQSCAAIAHRGHSDILNVHAFHCF